MPRAFSILEVVIALAIVVALASVVLPSLGARLADEAWRSTFDQVEAVLGESRQHAIAESRPLAVVASTRDGRWRLRERWEDDPDSAPATVFEAPDGLGFRLAGDPSFGGAAYEPEDPAIQEAADDIAVVTFLADGSAAVRAPVELSRAGETYRLVIGRWTNAVSFERVEPEADDGEEATDEPPVERDASDEEAVEGMD